MNQSVNSSFSLDRIRSGFLKFIAFVFVIAVICAILGGAYFGICYKYVDSYEQAYTFDKWSGGKITQVTHTGYVKAVPLITEAHTIDLRPMQVCISANGRVLNCKLVKFNPAGLDLFLAWHGRDDYKGPGNTTVGIQGCTTQFCEILKVYAFDESGKAYPFLTIEKKTAEAEK